MLRDPQLWPTLNGGVSIHIILEVLSRFATVLSLSLLLHNSLTAFIEDRLRGTKGSKWWRPAQRTMFEVVDSGYIVVLLSPAAILERAG